MNSIPRIQTGPYIFFLEHTEELHIIILRREKWVRTPSRHTTHYTPHSQITIAPVTK